VQHFDLAPLQPLSETFHFLFLCLAACFVSVVSFARQACNLMRSNQWIGQGIPSTSKLFHFANARSNCSGGRRVAVRFIVSLLQLPGQFPKIVRTNVCAAKLSASRLCRRRVSNSLLDTGAIIIIEAAAMVVGQQHSMHGC
jgi:hypothetical protein